MANLQHILMVSYDSIVEDALDIIGFGIKFLLLIQKILITIYILFLLGSLDADLEKAADVFYTWRLRTASPCIRFTKRSNSEKFALSIKVGLSRR